MDSDRVRIRLLGTVDVLAGGQARTVAGLRRKAAIAVLGLHVGQWVSTDQLADIVWAGSPPATAENMVQHQVAYLRGVLGDTAVIVTRRRGYVLDVSPEAVDVVVAEQIIHDESGGGSERARADHLRRALGLWRGPALADVAELPWLRDRADQLEQLRVHGIEALIDVRMGLGEDAAVAADLQVLVGQHPLRESFSRLLMLALYRTERQAEALAVYARLRHELAEQLGLDPSPPLRALEAAILRQDPSLDVAPVVERGDVTVADRLVAAGAPDPSHRRVDAAASPLAAAGQPADEPAIGTADALDGYLRAGEQALLERGDLGAGRRSFEAAYRLAERYGDATAMGRAALGLGGLWLQENRTAADAETIRARQQRALSLIDPQSSLALRLRLRIRLTAEADFAAKRTEDSLALLAEARRLDDVVALADGLRLAHPCMYTPDNGLRLEFAHELIAVASRTGRPLDLLAGLLYRTIDLLRAGDLRAERSLAELRDRLAVHHHGAVGFVVSGIEVMFAIRSGRLAEAETLAAATAKRGAAIEDRTTAARYIAQLATIRWYQGRIGELYPRLSEVVHSPSLANMDNSLFPVYGAAAAAAGDRRLAASALARMRGRGLTSLPRISTWLAMLFTMVDLAHELNDTDCSDEAYTLLAPFADIPVIGAVGVTCLGSTHHPLGIASLTCGQPDRAVSHLRSAVRDNLALGHLPAAVMSRHRLGHALALRDGPHEAAARAELAHAAHEATALGMVLPTAASAPLIDS
jgi:DNA-binding SARP family transcriptional activator